MNYVLCRVRQDVPQVRSRVPDPSPGGQVGGAVGQKAANGLLLSALPALSICSQSNAVEGGSHEYAVVGAHLGDSSLAPPVQLFLLLLLLFLPATPPAGRLGDRTSVRLL